ncbi:hypothetical protein [Sulfuricystis multivorans]|uniref:hypothetical protein n=1 Tax=Sulfuricystis multivorans TaxID=2211108 RepID=UPI000F83A67A|nr:hypothetical protein [Sulfuricystis multivorans]
MEKLLLLLALSGSAYMIVGALWKVVKAVAKVVTAVSRPSLTAKTHQSKPQTSPQPRPQPRPQPEVDWSKYDIPTFIRRGIPMPKLEPVKVKSTKTRKRRSKAKAAVTQAENAPTFEVVA